MSGAGLLLLPAFLDGVALERIAGALRTRTGAPASVYGVKGGGTVDVAVRSASRLTVPAELSEEVLGRLEDVRPQIECHFGLTLSQCEAPQFLHYRAGDFFVAHQDGNTPLTRDDSRARRVSIVVFLNEQSTEPAPGSYGGGDLVFHGEYPDWQSRHPVPAASGTLAAFRAETTHEVTPVTHGDRYTVVSWYR